MESTPQQKAEGQAIVKVLAAVLERLVCANTSLAVSDPGQITKFHALKSPGIGIHPYLDRIHKNNFLLTELNVHRVIITAILLAAKFFDDAYYNNAYYAKVGGVLVSEMNGLEVDFLFRINFSLHITPVVFEKYKAELVAHSVSTGLAAITIPQIPPCIPENVEVDQLVAVQTAAAPIETLSGYREAPPQVTPSPNHIAVQAVAAPVATVDETAVYSMYPPHEVIGKEFTQQFLQRAHSLPYPAQSGRCVDTVPAYHSAPMASMPYISSNPILPIQTTLVHHHHGEQANFPQGYALPREGIGSLVAGHY